MQMPVPTFWRRERVPKVLSTHMQPILRRAHTRTVEQRAPTPSLERLEVGSCALQKSFVSAETAFLLLRFCVTAEAQPRVNYSLGAQRRFVSSEPFPMRCVESRFPIGFVSYVLDNKVVELSLSIFPVRKSLRFTTALSLSLVSLFGALGFGAAVAIGSSYRTH